MKISEYHWYCFLKSKAVCKRWTEVKSAVGIIFSRCWVFCLGILNFDINIWFKTLLCQCRSLQTNVPILVGDISFERTINYGRVFSREVFRGFSSFSEYCVFKTVLMTKSKSSIAAAHLTMIALRWEVLHCSIALHKVDGLSLKNPPHEVELGMRL